jgi:signal transduction histidine kinase
MRLSAFIVATIEPILVKWEAFAKGLSPGGSMTSAALRDDAERMLRYIADDIESAQTVTQQRNKALGLAPDDGVDRAAHDHGVQRFVDGFTMQEMVAEYRALRASVTQLWLQQNGGPTEVMQELIRFNEAIDQVIAESVDRFTAKLEADRNLFIAILAHDLRSPLSTIDLSAHLVRRSSLSTQQTAAAERIVASSRRMQRMVVDLLHFAKLRLAGTIPLERNPCDLLVECEKCVHEVGAAHPGTTISLQSRGNTAGEWDAERLAQLITNLIENAVQYGERGRPVVVCLNGEDANAVSLSVANRGTPITPEDRERVFDPLRRGTGATTDVQGNLGLGLYIVRQIALAHGGHVELSQSDLESTVFDVRLPRKGLAQAV